MKTENSGIHVTPGVGILSEPAAVKYKLYRGDITKVKVDAIVNAANTSLLGGGGVDGAIHAAGGPEIMEECEEIRHERGGIATGEAVVTCAGKLAVDYIIHTAGPVWHGGKNGEARLLAKCYLNSLKQAERMGSSSLAFPNISTGAYAFPKERAAEIAVKTVKSYFEKREYPSLIKEVIFVCFDQENYLLYKQILASIDKAKTEL